MELTKLTRDELIELQIKYDKLKADSHVTPTGDIEVLLDELLPRARGYIPRELVPGYDKQVNQLRTHIAAFQSGETGWRELVRELEPHLPMARMCGGGSRSLHGPERKYANYKCPFCKTETELECTMDVMLPPETLCTNPDCPAVRARKLEEK